VLGPLGLTNTTDPGSPVIAEPVLHAWDSEQRSVYNIPPSLPFYVDSTYWDTSWSLAKGAIETTNIYDMDMTAIAIGNGKLLSPESFKTMTNTKMRDQGGPVPGCPQCHRGNDAYTYGMGVVIKGNWLLQDPLVNGYSALEAYLPSQRIAVSLLVTFAEDAFNKTTSSYPNEAVPIFERSRRSDSAPRPTERSNPASAARPETERRLHREPLPVATSDWCGSKAMTYGP
jgi:hypothetical protein